MNDNFRFSVASDQSSGFEVITLQYINDEKPVLNKQASIVPQAGANLYSLMLGKVELLRQPPSIADLPGWDYGIPILYPTPNRVENSKFTFDGETFRFVPNDGLHFLHGLVLRTDWKYEAPQLVEWGIKFTAWIDFLPSLSLFKFFPYHHTLTVTYILYSRGLKIEFSVENKDSRSLPFGFGIHPYFKILGTRKSTYVCVPAQSRMEAIDLLPTGRLVALDNSIYDLREPSSLGNMFFDDVYWGMRPEYPAYWQDKEKRLKVTLSASKHFTHMVIYSPKGETFFCMENQTCSTDAHNLFSQDFKDEAHLLIAKPGESIKGWIDLVILND